MSTRTELVNSETKYDPLGHLKISGDLFVTLKLVSVCMVIFPMFNNLCMEIIFIIKYKINFILFFKVSINDF